MAMDENSLPFTTENALRVRQAEALIAMMDATSYEQLEKAKSEYDRLSRVLCVLSKEGE
jgi:hypothetical protein